MTGRCSSSTTQHPQCPNASQPATPPSRFYFQPGQLPPLSSLRRIPTPPGPVLPPAACRLTPRKHFGRLAGTRNHKRGGQWTTLLASTFNPPWDPTPVLPPFRRGWPVALSFNELIGETPLGVTSVGMGSHDLVIRKTGFPKIKEKIKIVSGETMELAFSLNKEKPSPQDQRAPKWIRKS